MRLLQPLSALPSITAAITHSACSSPIAAERPASQNLGERVAILRCSSCHAVSRTDASAHPDAPPLRELSRSYPLGALRETLPQGLIVDHPDMPVFRLKGAEVDALLEHLEAIQSRQIAKL